MPDKPEPLSLEDAQKCIRAAAASGNVCFAPGPKVWRYPDHLRRFMNLLVGVDGRFFVSDGSHLHDFEIHEDTLAAIEAEFGMHLPTTDLYLWEVVMLLASVGGGHERQGVLFALRS